MTTAKDGPARPVGLRAALAASGEVQAPRGAARVNAYGARVATVRGDFVRHTHDRADDGEPAIAPRENGAERTVPLPRGAVFTVPRGTEHKPSSDGGAAILMFEPTGTVNTGNGPDRAALPDHITSTTGHALDQGRKRCVTPTRWSPAACS
ncbi:cupin domain-containing protein [Streptomyces specialis]|uniref:hypothetical protein n=1 Tax=Streptomyces specialis TaxID=498367 RepID=UPI00073ED607|nr:hypothetical protein [Streptomyces specialis]